MREALAAAMLTIGLTGFFMLALAGASPTLADAQFTLTSVFVSSIAATAVGVTLFVQIGVRNRRLMSDIARLVRYQHAGLLLYKEATQITDDAEVPAVIARINEWFVETTLWTTETFPTHAPMLLIEHVGMVHHGLSNKANQAASFTHVKVTRVSEVIQAVSTSRTR